MRELTFRLILLHLLLLGGLVLISRFIGQGYPPAPVAIFLDEPPGPEDLDVRWIDPRTGVAFRRIYDDVLLDRSFFGINARCQTMVRITGEERTGLGFLDLRTGKVRPYVSNGTATFFGQPSPDGRYWWFHLWDTTTTQLLRVILNLETGSYVTKPLVRGSYVQANWSPDGQHLIEVIGEAPQGATDYRRSLPELPAWLIDPETGAERRLEAIPGYVSWSPDSRLFATVNDSGTITIYDTTGQQQYQMQAFNDVSVMLWQPDHRSLLLIARSAANPEDDTTPYQMAIWSLDDEQMTLLPIELVPNQAVWLSPDNTRLYYDSPDAPPVILDVATGETILTLPEDITLRWQFWSQDNRVLLQLRSDDPNKRGYDGGLYLLEVPSRKLAHYIELPEMIRWQFRRDLAEFGYFVYSNPRLGRLQSGADGIQVEVVEQPGADLGVWCYPEAE